MKSISYDTAIQKIYKYTDRLAKEGKLQAKKDNFTIVLPLERRQAVIMRVAENDGGKRQVSFDISDCIFTMNQIKNTVLNIFEEDK